MVPSRIRIPMAGPRCEARCGPRNASSVSSRIPQASRAAMDPETATSNGFAPDPRQHKMAARDDGVGRAPNMIGSWVDATAA